jgi:hypothetical protein
MNLSSKTLDPTPRRGTLHSRSTDSLQPQLPPRIGPPLHSQTAFAGCAKTHPVPRSVVLLRPSRHPSSPQLSHAEPAHPRFLYTHSCAIPIFSSTPPQTSYNTPGLNRRSPRHTLHVPLDAPPCHLPTSPHVQILDNPLPRTDLFSLTPGDRRAPRCALSCAVSPGPLAQEKYA